jgi:hypothetical protein
MDFRLLQKALLVHVTESSIETDLRIGVEAKGGECLKWTIPGRKGPPDRIVLMPHCEIVFVETKAPNGRLEPWQYRFHKMLRRLGFRVEVLWTPKQVNEFLETLSS